MPDQVNPGLGTILQLQIASTFTTISQRVSLSGPSREMGTAETTHLDSTVRTFRGTILDNGELSGELEYDPQAPTHLAMAALMDAVPPVPGSWKLKLADSVATVLSFSGILTSHELKGMEIEGNLGADFTIKLTGLIVVTHT